MEGLLLKQVMKQQLQKQRRPGNKATRSYFVPLNNTLPTTREREEFAQEVRRGKGMKLHFKHG